MYKYVIHVDGSSLDNGTPEARGYGSCMIEREGATGQRHISWNFPGKGTTNNEAEYMALIQALEYLKMTFEGVGHKTSEIELTIRMDSALVIGQLTMGWRVRAMNLKSLHSQAKTLVSEFSDVKFVKIAERDMKKILGH
jgi:ribonuclease HI